MNLFNTSRRNLLAAATLSLVASAAVAQQAATDEWKYKTARLDRAAVDALLAKPQQLVVIDVRRPDELTAKGSFPVYLNIQVAELEKSLPYIPKERAILTVSNHAHRAGAAGDLLASKGFTVAGAAGSEDYEAQGGKAVVRVRPPVKAASAP
ncbi:MAG TPA: rhodanese-like domain-containing protein [Albitalea sp.]|uniref:rhodanese-like domain-containing protein n=1 Tax=Piscinibacter sp. TaxID=1903157 RepID=UPI002ED6B4A2